MFLMPLTQQLRVIYSISIVIEEQDTALRRCIIHFMPRRLHISGDMQRQRWHKVNDTPSQAHRHTRRARGTCTMP